MLVYIPLNQFSSPSKSIFHLEAQCVLRVAIYGDFGLVTAGDTDSDPVISAIIYKLLKQ